jgi:hypothetical protein
MANRKTADILSAADWVWKDRNDSLPGKIKSEERPKREYPEHEISRSPQAHRWAVLIIT